MVQGVMCCGTFVTKKALIVAASLSSATLLAGIITLGVGMGYSCYYDGGNHWYYNNCSATQTSLIINGGVVTSLGGVFLVVVCALACQIKDPFPPTMVHPQLHPTHGIPNMSPGQAPTHPPPVAPYPQTNMGYPQQYPAAAMPQMPMSPGQQMIQPQTATLGFQQQYPPAAAPPGLTSPP